MIALLVFSACSPTPRPEAVAAVIDASPPTDSAALPLPTQFTPFTPILGAQAPDMEEDVAEQLDLEISTPTVVIENPDANPTPHPDSPATCSAQPPPSALLRDLGYISSICRAPTISPDDNWIAFAQLTESYTGNELWLVERESGRQTLVKDPLWTTTSYSALGIAEWSGTNELLIIHNLATGTAPGSVLDPVSGQITNLDGVSSLAWNADRTAVVGWEFRAGCRFTRAIGFDFETNRVLHSATTEDEIVGRVFWTPSGDDFVYSRREIVGECPGCYYRSAELIIANTTQNIYTALVSDAGLDYLLLGYQGNNIAIGERVYTYHTCEAPEVP